jgi:hypothetical protein
MLLPDLADLVVTGRASSACAGAGQRLASEWDLSEQVGGNQPGIARALAHALARQAVEVGMPARPIDTRRRTTEEERSETAPTEAAPVPPDA